MGMKRQRFAVLFLAFASIPRLPLAAQPQCGGVERWPVKVGSDSRANQINLTSPVPISLHNLVNLPRPQLPNDDDTRLDQEKTVYVVQGRLLKFKLEAGRTGDLDYHLVITDDTRQFSPGGTNTLPSPHSFVAEIVKPDCVPGRTGNPATVSRFQSEIASLRTRFDQRFSPIHGGWNDAGGIPVSITGVGFFDRHHGQTGRAVNGIEIHPVLDISFDAVPPPPPGPVTAIIRNADFEDGPMHWVASSGVLSNDSTEPARNGNWKAWLGGYGETHTDTLHQQITIPATATAATLMFYLHISSEEQNSQVFDTLRVQIRSAAGQHRKTLATFSNLQAGSGFHLNTFSLTPYRGETIRIHFVAQEDNGSPTSFVLDDFGVVIE